MEETPEEDKEAKMKRTFDVMGYTMASGSGLRYARHTLNTHHSTYACSYTTETLLVILDSKLRHKVLLLIIMQVHHVIEPNSIQRREKLKFFIILMFV